LRLNPILRITKVREMEIPRWNPLRFGNSLRLLPLNALHYFCRRLEDRTLIRMFANLKPRVLIVDDEPQMRSALREALRPRTSYVSVTASAHEALNAIESGEYDIVISD